MSSFFFRKLHERTEAIGSWLCIGLDPRLEKIPQYEGVSDDGERVYRWCIEIIDATHEHTACYKPNSAFFECISPPSSGLASLGRVISHIASKHPTIPVLLDAKRGDIGSTSDAYAVAAYEVLGADGITLSPLMGADSVRPFVNRSAACTKRGGCFVLCKTSNTSSKEILGQKMEMGGTVYENITRLAVEWDDRLGKDAEEEEPHIGLVVGATDPSAVCTVAGALQKIDRGAGDGGRRSRRRPWILAPGVGAQGGDLVESVRVAMGSDGKGRILVSVSREVAHAEDPGQRAGELRKDIEAARVAAKAAVDADSTSSFLGLLPYQREFISFALAEEVLKFGSFTLKSGRTSPYFFNAGLFRTGRALSELGRAYADCVATEFFDKDGIPSFDVIFGPAYKGIGLGACVVSALWTAFGVDVGFAYNRKEAKDHGEGGVLVGSEMVGKRVLLIDDVISAGTAIRESFSLLSSINATPVGVVIALDRAEVRSLDDRVSAVQAVARDFGVKLASIVSLPQLMEYVRTVKERDGDKDTDIGDGILDAIVQYREKYGVD